MINHDELTTAAHDAYARVMAAARLARAPAVPHRLRLIHDAELQAARKEYQAAMASLARADQQQTRE